MIELTTAIALLVTSLYGGVNTAVAEDIINSENTQSKQAIESPITLEKYIQEYFKETPVLAKIAVCESTLRQVDASGQVLRGKVNPDDVGLMQINEFYHGDKAQELGMDLETIDGNLAYAKYLYEKEGTAPWSASAKCWKK